MDIKQLVLAAAGCLSYLAQAAPTDKSTAVAKGSGDNSLQLSPEGRLSSFHVTARHIPPYMQKIIAETFLERDNQAAKEAFVQSSYEDVDLQIGGESLFREKKQVNSDGPAAAIILTNETAHHLQPIPTSFYGWWNDIYVLNGVGFLPLTNETETRLLEQLSENQQVLCDKPIAVRGYSTKPGNGTDVFYYAACTPSGAPLFCMSERINCEELTRFQEVPITTQRGFGDYKTTNIPVRGPSNSSALLLPFLEIGHQMNVDVQSRTRYQMVGNILQPLGIFRSFAWGNEIYTVAGRRTDIRTYVSAKQLNNICGEVKRLCADDLRGCKTLTSTMTITPTQSMSASPYSKIYSTYVSCPTVVTTQVPFVTSSTSRTTNSVQQTTSSQTPFPSLLLTEIPTEADGLNDQTLAAGAVGVAVGGMLVLGVAGVLKLCSTQLKKSEMQISVPLPPLHEQEIYSEVRANQVVKLENYPPARPGVPPSRALNNLAYSRVRTISETSSNLTAGTVSTESTEAAPPLGEIAEEYIEMGSVNVIYDVPPESSVYNVLPPRLAESTEQMTNF